MFKKIMNSFKKKNKENIVINKEVLLKEEIVENVVSKQEEKQIIETTKLSLEIKSEVKIIKTVDNQENADDIKKIENNNIEKQQKVLTKEDIEYIKELKILRENKIKSINIYTKEEIEFESYDKCAKKLKVPKEYIIENLRYNDTEYFGDAIKYLSEKLNTKEYENNYIKNNKSPIQVYNDLNNKIFNKSISNKKREEILNSVEINPTKMHYTFEITDIDYDNYYLEYKDIIKRGGKKKIDLINTKGEVIKVFKSIDECASHLKKEKDYINHALKLGNTKINRYEIKYSTRNI